MSASGTTRKATSAAVAGIERPRNMPRRGSVAGPDPRRDITWRLSRTGARLVACRDLCLTPHGDPRITLLGGQVRREVRPVEDRRIVHGECLLEVLRSEARRVGNESC